MPGPLPVLSQQDYADVLSALAPQGRAWPSDATSVVQQVFAALAPTPFRAFDRASNLLTDAFPPTTVELLPEWQASLGLPDPCAGPSPILSVEQQQVLARFIAGGGQSVAFFISFALTLGMVITITQFAPFRAGVSTAGDPANDEAWAFAWQVNAPAVMETFFTVGNSTIGQPLVTLDGTDVLQCELQRLSPAHTKLIFSFGGESTVDSSFRRFS
jgi:uncharacterized protein YmfQ (DUF2313 family)